MASAPRSGARDLRPERQGPELQRRLPSLARADADGVVDGRSRRSCRRRCGRCWRPSGSPRPPCSRMSSRTTISSLILGRKSTTYSAPRYSSVCPFCRPKPRTSVTVMPWTPTCVERVLDLVELEGLDHGLDLLHGCSSWFRRGSQAGSCRTARRREVLGRHRCANRCCCPCSRRHRRRRRRSRCARERSRPSTSSSSATRSEPKTSLQRRQDHEGRHGAKTIAKPMPFSCTMICWRVRLDARAERRREDARGERAPGAAERVHAEDVERVVVAEAPASGTCTAA